MKLYNDINSLINYLQIKPIQNLFISNLYIHYSIIINLNLSYNRDGWHEFCQFYNNY